MPLVVPILRLAMLFLNIYETYKTLKAPPVSARNGGRPSVRAVTQRKRDMKGCLAIWIVWCCFAAYERLLEAVVYLFVPFYDELKSLVLLFLILTRARGAEPIYLHVIRPMIKPYTPTLDMLLDLTCMFGDIIFVISMFPFRLALSWWQSSIGNTEDLVSEDELVNRSTGPNVPQPKIEDVVPALGQNADLPQQRGPAARPQLNTKRTVLQNSVRAGGGTRRPSADLAQGTVRTRRQALQAAMKQQNHASVNPPGGQIPERGLNTTVSRSQHQIWYPPPSSYPNADETILPTLPSLSAPQDTGVSNPPVSPLTSETPAAQVELARERAQLDEWRQYPPFPSAYPPTPLPPSLQLFDPPDTTIVAPAPRRLSDAAGIPCIPENGVNEGFGQSLLPPRKPLNPGSVGNSSDNDSILGIRHDEVDSEDLKILVDDAENEADEENEDEDDFDVTLRTPLPPFGNTRSRIYTQLNANALPFPALSSTSSLPSPSTALTTVDDGSSLRTRTTSESSASVSISDSSSVTGQKRSFPRADAKSRRKMYEQPSARNLPRGRAVRANRSRPQVSSHMINMSQQQIIRGMSITSGGSASDSDEANTGELIVPDVKRRRVAGPQRDVALPTRTRQARGTGSLQDQDTAPKRGPQAQSLEAPHTSRTIPRRRAAPRSFTAPSGESSQISSTLDLNQPQLAPRRASERNAAKKKDSK